MRINCVLSPCVTWTMNPRYPKAPDSSLAEVRGSAANCFTKLSASALVRTHAGFGLPEKMSSSTSTRAGIDSFPFIDRGRLPAVHAGIKNTHAMTRVTFLHSSPALYMDDG